jgi:hypothetical protein
MRFSKILLGVLVASCASLARAEPADVCVSVFAEAEQVQTPVASAMSGRNVVGTGRLFFHVAPDQRCQLKNVFVIPGDRLEAYADFGEFTSVIYWNSATGAGTAGWVLTSRLAETGAAIAAGPVLR